MLLIDKEGGGWMDVAQAAEEIKRVELGSPHGPSLTLKKKQVLLLLRERRVCVCVCANGKEIHKVGII